MISIEAAKLTIADIINIVSKFLIIFFSAAVILVSIFTRFSRGIIDSEIYIVLVDINIFLLYYMSSIILVLVIVFTISINSTSKFKFNEHIPYAAEDLLNAISLVYSDKGFGLGLSEKIDRGNLDELMKYMNGDLIYEYQVRHVAKDGLSLLISAVDRDINNTQEEIK